MNAIKQKRIEATLSQRELAKMLGVKSTTVSMWEVGTNLPKANTLINMSKIFNCTVDELLQIVKEHKH